MHHTTIKCICAAQQPNAGLEDRQHYIQANIQPHAPKQWMDLNFLILNDYRFMRAKNKELKTIPPKML
jgi:hypothetical protein